MNRQALDAAWQTWVRGQPAPEPGAEWRAIRLTDEEALVVRQELYHTAHKLESLARHAASPRGTRHRALLQRAALLRSVADQFA